MALNNITLLGSSSDHFNIVGDPVRGSGVLRSMGGVYTVSITGQNLTGRVYIEATMAPIPTDSDWFAIPYSVTGLDYVSFTQSSTTIGMTFRGNFVWLRARLDRSYLGVTLPISSNDLGLLGLLTDCVVNVGPWTTESNPSTGAARLINVSGRSLGRGEPMFVNTTGSAFSVLNFQTLLAGNAISLTTTADGIVIDCTANGVGGSSGSGGGYRHFVDLIDVPATITTHGLLMGNGTSLTYVDPPTVANTTLVYSGTDLVWRPVVSSSGNPNSIAGIGINSNGTSIVSSASELNFSGNAVSISLVSGVPTVTVNHKSGMEQVSFQYSGGSNGNFAAQDALLSNSAGVSANIIDGLNSIVEFTFTGYFTPPSSIALLGQLFLTNEFNYANVTPALGTRKITSGGTAANPTLLTSFTGPITLQLRMSDVGASAPAGHRAKVIVMFKF